MGSSPDAYLPHWTGIGPVYAWVRGSGNSTVEVEDLDSTTRTIRSKIPKPSTSYTTVSSRSA
jgi:hypothetical protein